MIKYRYTLDIFEEYIKRRKIGLNQNLFFLTISSFLIFHMETPRRKGGSGSFHGEKAMSTSLFSRWILSFLTAISLSRHHPPSSDLLTPNARGLTPTKVEPPSAKISAGTPKKKNEKNVPPALKSESLHFGSSLCSFDLF
jgi:hypothetical protein